MIMYSFTYLFPPLVVATAAIATMSCSSFPPSMRQFSSQFQQPLPPLVKSEFNTSFVQHKWDQTLSHITTGTISNSPSTLTVLVNEAYYSGSDPGGGGKEGLFLASSRFNYANLSADGSMVDNVLTTWSTALGGITEPAMDVWRGYVVSNFPLFTSDILRENNAVFGGLVDHGDLFRTQDGPVGSWNILYLGGTLPVTVYVDACNIVVGYGYFSPNLRTRVVNVFFNTRAI